MLFYHGQYSSRIVWNHLVVSYAYSYNLPKRYKAFACSSLSMTSRAKST